MTIPSNLWWGYSLITIAFVNYFLLDNFFILQFDLVCNVSALSALNKAVMFLGYMIGVLVGGVLSDKFGRKPVVFYLSVMCNILALVCVFCQGLLGVRDTEVSCGSLHR